MTAPIFKPFVLVRIPLPSGCTLLPDPGVHMNNDGVVVATMNNGSNNYGYIWYDEMYTDGWQGPLEDGSGDIILDNAGLRGINDELEICGTRSNSGPKAFFLALTSTYAGTLTQIGTNDGYAKDINNQGVVVGTSVNGTPVGWWDSANQPVPLPALPNGSGTNAVGITLNTAPLGSLAVGQRQDASSRYQAVVWYYSGGWQVEDLTGITGSDVGFAVDVNDDGVIIGGLLTSDSISDTIHWYYDEIGDEWTGVSLAASPVFIPEAINDQANPEIVGDKYLWVSTSVASGTGEQIDLTSMSLGLPSNMINMRCTDINDAGEIVGVGQLGSGGDWVAFKLVPYDVDNDHESDVYEIATGAEDDTNGNWLIDWAESIEVDEDTYVGMRVGLHAAGYSDSAAHDIPHTQAVRLALHLLALPNDSWPEGEYVLNEILDPQMDECSFRTDIERWARGDDWQREIVVWMRSTLEGSESEQFDFLPTTTAQRDLILGDLREFGYKYARCIDWVQFGNEAFGGAGQYYFRTGELGGSCGEPLSFGQIQNQACYELANATILDWLDAQMWATLEGSALAGRPLRMISAAVSQTAVNDGYENDNPHRYLVSEVSDWVNGRQMYFDMHTIWDYPDDAVSAAHRLKGISPFDPPPWTPPNLAVALEWRPKVDNGSDWYTNNLLRFSKFHKDNGCNDPPGMSWDDFVTSWRVAQFGQNESFGMAAVLEALSSAGFTVACYGQTWMQPQPSFIYDTATFLANGVCEEYRTRLLTKCFDEFHDDVSDEYFISDFTPHGTACPQCQ